jgi:hypothetical protein
MEAPNIAVRSAYLGQYTDEVANLIAGALEHAEISWSYKQAAFVTRIFLMGEWGTRLFVDSAKLDEAKEIADRAEILAWWLRRHSDE